MPRRNSKKNRNDASAGIRKAYQELQKVNQEIKEAHMAIVLKLAIVAEYRDADTGGHIMRISDYGCEVAKGLGLSDKEIENYRFASPMHDIGKIATPDAILKKQGKLTPEEYEIMKTHTVIGARMFDGSNSPILKAAAEICRSHHERWDGKGYPYGLKKDKIPLFARILTVVDVFDALTTKRCYKDAWGFKNAEDYLKAESGKLFDPRVVNTFFKALPEIRKIYQSGQAIQNFITEYEIMNSKMDEIAKRSNKEE